MRSKPLVSIAVGGLALLVAGLLCGLVPFSIHVPEYGVKSSEPYVSGKTPQFYSAAHDKYCGSAWVQQGCSYADFGTLPQLSVLFVALGIVGLGAALTLYLLRRPQ